MSSATPQTTPFEPKDYWEDRFKEGPTLSRTGYIGMGQVYNRWLYRGFASGLELLLARSGLRLTRSSRVVDAGAGAGFLERILHEQGVQDVTGLDFTSAAVEHLKTAYPAYEFQTCDLTQPLDRELRRADFVFCLAVLYHILTREGLQQAIENLAALTRQGGYVIIADNFLPAEREYDGSHQRHWSKREMEALLHANGVEPLCYQPIFFTLNSPMRYQESWVGARYHQLWFKIIRHFAGSDRRSRWIAPLLYGLDHVGQRLLRRGPSTHYLLCRKAG